MATEQPKSLLERAKEMGTEIGLEGERLEKYVDNVMSQAGWKRESNWLPPEGDSDKSNEGKGWF